MGYSSCVSKPKVYVEVPLEVRREQALKSQENLFLPLLLLLWLAENVRTDTPTKLNWAEEGNWPTLFN